MEGSSPRSPKHSTISIAAWGVNGGKEGATCKTVLLENKGSRVSGKRCSARTKTIESTEQVRGDLPPCLWPQCDWAERSIENWNLGPGIGRGNIG